MVFYFSGTGNSLAVATHIAQQLDEQLVSMAASLNRKKHYFELSSTESVGIVCPVYNWGLPTIVISFLEQMQLPARLSPFIYVVFVCGASVGTADRQLSEVLNYRGYILDAAYSITMPDNYIIAFNFATPENKVDAVLQQAYLRLEPVVKAIKEHHPDEHLLSRGHFPHVLSLFGYPSYKNGRSTEPFHVDNTCNSCGLCQHICPVKAIKLFDGHPVWIKPTCVQCLACIHRCPQRAIQYGKKTVKATRYIHPDLKSGKLKNLV